MSENRYIHPKGGPERRKRHRILDDRERRRQTWKRVLGFAAAVYLVPFLSACADTYSYYNPLDPDEDAPLEEILSFVDGLGGPPGDRGPRGD